MNRPLSVHPSEESAWIRRIARVVLGYLTFRQHSSHIIDTNPRRTILSTAWTR
jgi:hypothetical protein